MRKFTLIVLFSLLLGGLSQAQDFEFSDVSRLTEQDYINMQLPPLGDLMDSARKSPIVEFSRSYKQVQQSELKSVRRQWLNYVRINGSYQYGSFYDYTQFYDINNQLIARNTDQVRGNFTVGATLTLPLLEIFDRNNRIKRQKHAIEQIDYEVAIKQEEQTLKVAEAYVSAAQSLAVLKSLGDAATVAAAQYKVSEAEFVNGKMSAQTLSDRKNIQVRTLHEYEQARAALNLAILRLELLTHTNIVKK